MAAIHEVRQIVMETRRATAITRPCPDVPDSIDFGRTENTEGRDADLRQKPQYMRNHARNMDPVRERAQTAEMIATALMLIEGGARPEQPQDGLSTLNAQAGMHLACARLAWSVNDTHHAEIHLTLALQKTLEELMALNVDPVLAVRAECARILDRFRPVDGETAPVGIDAAVAALHRVSASLPKGDA